MAEVAAAHGRQPVRVEVNRWRIGVADEGALALAGDRGRDAPVGAIYVLGQVQVNILLNGQAAHVLAVFVIAETGRPPYAHSQAA